jgi:16S rRNA (uracil1498-N3)-methyltransferase
MSGMTEVDRELTYSGGGVRLYVEASLEQGAPVALNVDQSHYLANVMRAKTGDKLALFNGRDGEWAAEVSTVSKRSVTLTTFGQIGRQIETPDIWLVLAPIKKTPLDYVTQKAAELGVRAIQPVITRRTIVSRVNTDRMRANAIEAAEQSGRVSVPHIREPLALDRLLDGWDAGRALLFCDEGGEAKPIATVRAARAAVITGPEGGFDPTERAMLRAQPFVIPVTLGPRILRADTAALAALAIWQSACGDWT